MGEGIFSVNIFLFILFQRRFKACAMYILDTRLFFYFCIEGGRPLLDSFIGRLPDLHDLKRGTIFTIAQDQRRISLDLVSFKKLRLVVRPVGLRHWPVN